MAFSMNGCWKKAFLDCDCDYDCFPRNKILNNWNWILETGPRRASEPTGTYLNQDMDSQARRRNVHRIMHIGWRIKFEFGVEV